MNDDDEGEEEKRREEFQSVIGEEWRARERLREINTTHSNENAGVPSTSGEELSERLRGDKRERTKEKKSRLLQSTIHDFMVPLCGWRRSIDSTCLSSSFNRCG